MQIRARSAIRDYVNGRDLILEAGDIATVPDEWGRAACANGWVEDIDGVVPTGEPSRDPVAVHPQNVTGTSSSR